LRWTTLLILQINFIEINETKVQRVILGGRGRASSYSRYDKEGEGGRPLFVIEFWEGEGGRPLFVIEFWEGEDANMHWGDRNV
jgi:hypothetical protein